MLQSGSTYATDRSYDLPSVPLRLEDAAMIKTLINGKNSSSSSLLAFSLTQDAKVSVAHDLRATALPAWLGDWQKLPDIAGVKDRKIDHVALYSKTSPAGQVALSGNAVSPAGAMTNFFVVAKQATASLVTNISANSSKSYSLSELALGALYYTDRTYDITAVPAALAGASLIRTPNDDKKNTSTNLLSFSLSQEAAVYVAYDPRATALPAWLSGWQKMAEKIGVNDASISNMDLYSKVFPAGQVVLGGNLASPASGSSTNYFVIAKATAVTSPSGTGCPLLSPMPCDQLQVALPFSLSFSGPVSGTVPDKSSAGTGFTLVDAYSGARHPEDGSPANPSLPGHEPARLSLSGGRLQLTTNKGIAWLTNNNQLNTLGVRVDSRARLNAAVTVVSPYSGTGSQQAGLWFGLNDKTYLKLVAVGGKVELRRETNDASPSSDQRLTGAIAGISSATVRLRMLIDPGSATAEGFYSLNGGAEQSVGAPLSISGMGITSSTAHAGIFATHRNGSTPVTYTFDDFSIATASAAGNNPPVIVKAPSNQVFDINQSFQFSGGQYSDSDAGDVLTYTATKSDGSALPGWLQFNASTVAFSGTAPSSGTLLSVKVTATDKSNASVSATFTIAVQSVEDNPYMLVVNMDKFQSPDRLSFSLIQIPWRRENSDGTYTPYNENHNKVRLKLTNGGTGSLVISKLELSNSSLWKIATINSIDYDAGTALPISLASSASAELVIEFIAKDLGGRVKIRNDKLTITSNDASKPLKEVLLHGLWQYKGEGGNEPYAQEIIKAFGFLSQTGYTVNDGVIDGNYVVPNSDEILSPFFVRADPARPVSVIQMAAYHGCCSATETIKWYNKGSASSTTTVFTHNGLDGQSLLPRKSGTSTTLAQGTFNPTGPFGIKVSSSYLDRSMNLNNKIGIRIWKAIDSNGNIIPNAFIMSMDYLNSPSVNYDYNDNMYYISNVKPEVGTACYSELVPTPSAADFGSVLTGAGRQLTVSLKNQGKTYADGSSDPAVTIKSYEIVGQNKDQFTATAPSATTIGVQGNASISVNFNPNSLGTKNAVLLIHYNSADSPLRVPLYGAGNDPGTSISVVKRIKSAADANVTINGATWEADKNYRQGSIKLDKQVVAGPIAATDHDVLYQTYLSAATNLAQTRYAIPLSTGTYTVRMHFVENQFTAPAARVFGFNMEGTTKLSGLDIYQEVGYRTALVKDFAVSVSDGTLNIDFNPTVDRVAIAGLEIFTASSSSSITQASTATLQHMPDAPQLQVYPNPGTGDRMSVALQGFGKAEKVSVTLYDTSGRVVESLVVDADQQGAYNAEVTLRARLNQGLYLIRAQAASGEARAKLMVE
ncbi:malectin domain-containing carbohydrate-binding protein [Pontibacter sp. CAU 1760]